MSSSKVIPMIAVAAVLWLLWSPAIDAPVDARQRPVAADSGYAAAVLGVGASTTPIVVPAPVVPSTSHARADCPTGGWVTHGDGHRTRCVDCDPSWTASDEVQQVVIVPQVVEPVRQQTIAEELGVDDPSLASPRWTFPGTIQGHLSRTHDVPNAAGLSRAEAIDLHNRIHNAEARGLPVGAVSYTAQDCPDGLCPTDSFGNILASDCPSGSCPTSSGMSSGSGVLSSSGSLRRPLQGVRERKPVRSLVRRILSRRGGCN
jgi:hypothetical protein